MNPEPMSRYAELHCKTNFSFLEGASHADELVARAEELGYTALAVTDRNSLAGVVRAHGAVRQLASRTDPTRFTENDAGSLPRPGDVALRAGTTTIPAASHGWATLPCEEKRAPVVKLIVGAEITLVDAPHVVLWVPDRAAYGRLSRLITVGRRRAGKGACSLAFEDLALYADGLLAGIVPPPRGQSTGKLDAYHALFGDRGYLLAECDRGPDDAERLEWLKRLARTHRLPLLAAGDVYYHMAGRKKLHDVLTAIRHGTTVDQAGRWLQPNAQRHLRRIGDIVARFARLPGAVDRTVEVAERCHFSLGQLRYEYPRPDVPPGQTPLDYLKRLSWEGAHQRYPRGISDKVRRLLNHELALIGQLHYEAYFLTVWDLVRFARSRHILCQGRGSAANSAVCYCLGITAVDPARMDVLFERFVSRERDEAPDIDVDFEHQRREEVLQYLYTRYGRERAGIAAEVICYRPRSAVRDVGKALGFSAERVDAVAKRLEGYHHEPDLAARCQQCGIDPVSRMGRMFVTLVEELIGFPRHLSQHVGGMVVTEGPLCELVPIENGAMPDRTVIEWDKDDLDELGILKIDCLALGMLTAIRRAFSAVERHYARRLTLADIPPEDPRVYDMICRAETMGVFQIESRAQMSMLPRLRPRTFYDLIIEIAIVRPGPIQGNMVHPYLRRRDGDEPVTYPNDAIRRVLHKTLGIPLFQEQAMRLAVVAAGFTPGEADQLRRAMGAWRRPGLIDRFRRKLLAGMRDRGLNREFAEQVFAQIRGFGEYGFPESHAASFALLVYVSAWLKYHYPAAFTVALLNSQPMGFYAPAQLLRDAAEHGVEIRPVDVNHSDYDCTLEEEGCREPFCLRLGFRMVAGLVRSAAATIQDARGGTPYRTWRDFVERTGLSRGVLERLAAADAFGSLGLNRRQALWSVLGCEQRPRAMPLFAELPETLDLPVELPEMDRQQEVYADYRSTGLSLRAHPLEFYRRELERLKVVPANKLVTWPNNRPVRVAGLVLVRQRPSTARGVTFVTLEDETGPCNLVIGQSVWRRFNRVARTASALIAGGRLERRGEVIHVVVNRLEDLTEQIEQLPSRSRDFR